MRYYSVNSNRLFSHDQSTFLLCKTPSNNFSFNYSNILINQINFYFPKLYFSLLRALYTLDSLSLNCFFICFIIVRENILCFEMNKNYFIPIFKAIKLKEYLHYYSSYVNSRVHILLYICSLLYQGFTCALSLII